MARGFTLIELMVCLAVISVLAVVTVPVAELVAQRERERELRSALTDIRNAIDAYQRAGDEGRLAGARPESGYPARLEVLLEGVPDKGGGTLYFLRRIPRDPFAADRKKADWGLRSFASSAKAPRPGADVYDVYSLSEGTGLNGVPYREW